MKTNLSQTFLSAVQRKDIPYLRSIITSRIIDDPTFKECICDDYMSYLANSGLDITEPYQLNLIEEITPTDPDKWSKDLFLDKVEFLRTNFAYEKRIKELKQIGPAVYAKDVTENQQPNFSKAPKGRRSEKKNPSLAAMIGVVAAVAAIIAVIAMLVKR